MKDYSKLGLDEKLKPINGIASRPSKFITALQTNINQESSPYLNRTAVQNRGGTIQANLGGVFEVRDTTGGTVLLTIDPDSGTVTIAGPIQANVTLNLGTINDTTLAGNGTIGGTITNNRLINGGTINNGTLGTPAVTGGTINSFIAGTPDITGGTMDSAGFGTPTLQDSTFNGTTNFDVNAGSPALGGDGDFALETHSGSVILVARSGGTTFYFTSAGTLA